MKNHSLSGQFREALDYIMECRKYIYVAIMIFFVSAVFGFVFADRLRFIDGILAGLVAKAEGLNGFELFFFILQNNIQAAFLALLL